MTQKNQSTKQVMVILLAAIMVLAMMPSMVFATDETSFTDDHDRISIGTGEPLELVWTSTTSDQANVVATNSSYYPDTFTLYVQNPNGTPTVTSGTGTITYAYDAAGSNKAYIVSITTAATITVNLASATANSGVYKLNCSAPSGTRPTAGTPTAVNGYLPVGQFASGTNWGSLFTDGTNLTGTTKKFLSGYSATGVSLGAAGGYTEFNLRVSNTSTNPYGVDFIVYGNAFNGNPEAGSVKVYGFTGTSDTNGKWYELAGSLYYDDVTQQNKDVYYKKVATATNSTAKGIYYQVTEHGVAPTDGDWTQFTTNTAWWPEDTEGYNNVWGSVDDVTRTDNIIAYKGVTLVKDTDTTNDYQFGYADVHINGSNYGTAINPYVATNTSTGGDGFDLSWAVDENGEPVALDHITKVRVYTSAAMKSDGSGKFTVPSIFGETSTEICAVYGVNGTGAGVASKAPTIACSGNTLSHSYLGITTVNAVGGSVSLNITGRGITNMYANGEKLTSGTAKTFTVGSGETKYVRVITQTGTESPYITMLKLVG